MMFAAISRLTWVGIGICLLGLAWCLTMQWLLGKGHIRVINQDQPASEPSRERRLNWEWLPAIKEFANARARAHGQPPPKQ